MSTPRWLRLERQRRAERKRWPARYITSVQVANAKAFEDEMAKWSQRQIWTTGDAR